ncbi:uncharacterized protein LOC134534465 [Bacillus rossius redtenbacheri]|uniref:uncharacterized protein LOC134534465 n=1 Tax=Bacillus rossius redtenbacheri TaxID=93214 RepID=UPI002FDDF435
MSSRPVLLLLSLVVVAADDPLAALADCGRADGPWGCLKARAIDLLDRAERPDVLRLADGLALVRREKEGSSSTSSTTPRESPLPAVDVRAAGDDELDRALASRLSRFLGGHAVQLSLPQLDQLQLQRSLEEGRGKMKKMMGQMMMMMGMKMMMFGVLGIAGLFLLAGKALIVSKIALLLSGILALKKLVSQHQEQHHEHHEMPHGGGWGRRSFRGPEAAAAAQRLAYSAQRPSSNDV